MCNKIDNNMNETPKNMKKSVGREEVGIEMSPLRLSYLVCIYMPFILNLESMVVDSKDIEPV